jgi:hypothetical protein
MIAVARSSGEIYRDKLNDSETVVDDEFSVDDMGIKGRELEGQGNYE